MKISQEKITNEWMEYTLSNDYGMSVSFLNYGGIITKLITPNQHGELENLVLGYENYQEYKDNPNCFGGIIGRVAGRIQNASFQRHGKNYELTANEGSHQLHGGETAFHHVIWDVAPMHEDNKVAIKLTHTSPDGEGNYPGEVHVSVTYSLTNDNHFIINYEAISDKDTVLTLTNHTYFNLSGLTDTVGEHSVTMNSDHFLELDEELIPTGKRVNVSNTPFDLRHGKRLEEGFDSTYPQNIIVGNGYDHYFLLNDTDQPNIFVKHNHSGRTLSITTNQPGVVMYTANGLEDDLKLNGRMSEKHLGVCFETQGPPASLHHEGLPSITLDANEVYKKQTVFSFGHK
ncbi:MAG TPA: aldose epimerase family protein [Virgibacillus sp.]|nr:aldose epimerase family protein [Virgibacillus sp.]HLR68329.1 aldose epimerase family protein [Virgibacillus sp.]